VPRLGYMALVVRLGPRGPQKATLGTPMIFSQALSNVNRLLHMQRQDNNVQPPLISIE